MEQIVSFKFHSTASLNIWNRICFSEKLFRLKYNRTKIPNSTAHNTRTHPPTDSTLFVAWIFPLNGESFPAETALGNVSLEFYTGVQLLIDKEKRDAKHCARMAGGGGVIMLFVYTFFYRPIYYNRKYGRESQHSGAPQHARTGSGGPRPATADELSKSTRCVLSRELYISIFHSHLLPPYFIAFFECDLSRNNFFLFRCRRRRAGRDLNVYQERNEAFEVKASVRNSITPG